MPRQKFAIGSRVVANDKGPTSYAGMRGTVVELGPGRAEYGIKLDGRPYPVEYLLSPWLDAIEHEQSVTLPSDVTKSHQEGPLP